MWCFQLAPPLPHEPPPEGSSGGESLPSTPELLSPDSDYKVAPLAGLEEGLDESSSESVTPDMDSQVLFVKLKEVRAGTLSI